MMKKINYADAIQLYQQSAESYCQDGRLAQGAKIYNTVGEIYE